MWEILATATRSSSGPLAFFGNRGLLRAADRCRRLDGLCRLFIELGASEELALSMILAAKRTREPITVLVPLIWLESQQGQARESAMRLSPISPVPNGIPMYAFDMHTRLGQAAIQKLIQESKPFEPVWSDPCQAELAKAAQMAAFYTDGVSCFAPP